MKLLVMSSILIVRPSPLRRKNTNYNIGISAPREGRPRLARAGASASRTPRLPRCHSSRLQRSKDSPSGKWQAVCLFGIGLFAVAKPITLANNGCLLLSLDPRRSCRLDGTLIIPFLHIADIRGPTRLPPPYQSSYIRSENNHQLAKKKPTINTQKWTPPPSTQHSPQQRSPSPRPPLPPSQHQPPP